MRKLAGLFILTLVTQFGLRAATGNLSLGETNLNLAIPDGNPSGVARTLSVHDPAFGPIREIRVRLRTRGGYNGDLYASLTHRDATGHSGFSVLLNRVGRSATDPNGSAGSGLDVALESSGGGGDIHLSTNAPGTVLSGTFEADGRLENPEYVTGDASDRVARLDSFLDADVNGAWTLFITDLSSGLGATLEAWSVDVVATERKPLVTPPDLVLNNDKGGCEATAVVLGNAQANVPWTALTNDAPARFPIGVTSVVWTLVTTEGVALTATQRVTVVDAEAPSLAVPAEVAFNTAGGCAVPAAALASPVATDNCGLALLTNNAPAAFPVGVTLVTWTAIDAHGNSSTARQRVSVLDTNYTCPDQLPWLPLITEFMAANSHTLADEDGDYVDWVEIHNPGPFTINLRDWALTDLAGNLARWRFPATNMGPGQYWVVFLSNKNRAVAGRPLHANFKLESNGEYLALTTPGGLVTSQFAPLFPAQFTDVSFGLGAQWAYSSLVNDRSPARVLVPLDDSLGTGWTMPEFADAGWLAGTNGAGFETGASELPPATATLLGLNPAGFWRLDETAGLVAQNTGAGGPAQNGSYLNGTLLGQPGPQGAAFGGFEADNRAARFDGLNDRIDVPYSGSLNPATFTVSCWARITGGAGTYRSPLSSRADAPTRGYIFYAGAANTWEFWTGTGGAGTWDTIVGPAVVTNQWVHLVGTYDGTTKAFYINGVAVGSKATAFSPNDGSPFRLGAGRSEDPAGGFFFPGEVDEAAVFSRALSAVEIQRLYQSATNSVPAGAGTGNFFLTGLIRTDLQSRMLGRSSGAYLRLPFQVTNATGIGRLTLRMRYDDGFIAYLNGQPVAWANQPDAPAWNSTATGWRLNSAAVNPVEFDLSDARELLRAGPNVLAIHGLNVTATNGDFLILAELEAGMVTSLATNARYFAAATPGAPNSFGAADLGPVITLAGSTPALPVQPTTNDALSVTAAVGPAFAPVAAVTLHWRVMFGITNQVPMLDDGQHGDGAAGDGVFGAAIPAGVALPGQMIRWFITATDTAARGSRWPLFDDPLNTPEYEGTVVADPSLASGLPVWQWFAADYAAAHNRSGQRGAVCFNGEFYDNVYIRQRGGFTAQLQSQKFDFNTGFHCRISDEVGRVEEANLNGAGADPSYLRPPLAFEVFRTAGHPASECVPMLLRFNGAPDRVGLYLEQVDERFLNRRGLDLNGSLYKFTQRAQLTPAFSDATDGVEKKTRLAEDHADLQAVVDALQLTNNIEARAALLFDRLNLAGVVNYLACRAVVRDTDDVRKNWYFFRDTEGSGEWTFFPWDKDYSFGIDADAGIYAKHPFLGDANHRKPNAGQWNMLWEAMFTDPRTRQMYLRRLRTLMDAQLQAAPGYLEDRLDAWFAPVQPLLGTGAADASNAVVALKGYLAQRRTELYVTFAATNVAAGVDALLPEGQPTNAVVLFGEVDYNPASGNQLEEYIQLVNPNPYAVDISGWKVEGAAAHRFRPGTVILPTNTLYLARNVVAFRARATGPRGGQILQVQGNFNGTLSALGEPLALRDDADRLVSSNRYLGLPTLAQRQLRVTEVMFNPAPPPPGSLHSAQEFEFVEVRNISATDPLDLHGIRFDNGIDFDFTSSSVTSLAPGAYALVVENTNAFFERYGGGLPVAGQYSGNLDNGGERIRLVDAVGEDVQDFNYEGGWHKSADGRGHSLVVRTESAPESAWNHGSNWLASACVLGSPGRPEPAQPCDTDGDGLPDWWELDHGTNLALFAVGGDADGDGVPDAVELGLGTDPADPLLPPRIAGLRLDAGGAAATLLFQARSNRSYIVEMSALPGLGAWVGFTNVPALPSNRWEAVSPPLATSNLFFRLVIP
jgi:subtilisin-like proprotein convertase family protein